MRLRIPIFALALAVAIAAAVPALFAHAELQKTDPADNAMLTAPPSAIQLWFDEKPDLAVSSIELTGPSGPVALGPIFSLGNHMGANIKGTLAPASYKVNWQTAGDDGHVSKGTFSFMVHGH
jgi:methionine-rich copper-binding protein CopC